MIDKVVKDKLCTNCGTCISACPVGAISYKQKKDSFEIRVNKKKCIKCGLCLKVCSGREVDFKGLNKEIFGKEKRVKYDSNLGYFKNCYLGYSRDKELRFQCSSGGTVTSILIYLLKKKIIDGVLVTTMDPKKPLISKPFIAYSEKEIIEARGSKYTPVVLNQCLEEIIKSKKKKFAVVGLPCHIHGIRKFQKINPALDSKIKICLGIMCGEGVNFYGTSFILKHLGIKPNEVKRIRYRGDGWPGKITAVKKNGGIKKISFHQAFKPFSMGFFNSERCFLCTDLTNELADISFGDAWIPRLMKDKSGINCVIARTPIGQKLVDLTKGDIFYKRVSPSLVVKSQKMKLFSKKDSYQLLTGVAKLLRLGVPVYTKKPESKIKLLSIVVIISYLNSFLSNRYPKFFLAIPLFIWNLTVIMYRKLLSYKKKK